MKYLPYICQIYQLLTKYLANIGKKNLDFTWSAAIAGDGEPITKYLPYVCQICQLLTKYYEANILQILVPGQRQ